MKTAGALLLLAMAGAVMTLSDPAAAQQGWGQWGGQGQQDPWGGRFRQGQWGGQDPMDWRAGGAARIRGFDPSIISKATLLLPEEKAVAENLQKAEALEKEGQWNQAANIYQTMMAENADEVLVRGEGVYEGVKEYCERLLKSDPPARLKAYRENFDHVAKHYLTTALRDSNFSFLLELADRFSLTSVGEEALSMAGDLAYEDGRFEEAFYYWGKLIRLYPKSLRLAALVPKGVLAARRAPDNAHVLTTLSRLAAAEGLGRKEVVINKKKLTLDAYLSEFLSTVPKSVTAEYRSLKDYFYPKPYEIALDVNVWRWKAPSAGAVPAVEGNYLAVRYNESMWIFNAQTGGLLRHTSKKASGSSEPMRSLLHNVTLNRGQAYAPLWITTTRPGGARLGVMDKPIQNVYGFDPVADRIIWDQETMQLNVKSAPEVTEDHIYAVMEFLERPDTPPEYRVVCYDRATGKVTWMTFLCSNMTGFNTIGTPSIDPFPQVLAVYGDTVYVSTNAGLISALESRTGSIKWMYTYTTVDPQKTSNLFVTPPLLDQGLLLVAPQDSPHLICLDAATGMFKWKVDMKARGQCEGIVDGRAVISGSSGVTFLEVATGKHAGGWSHPSGKDTTPVGKGALSKKYLYLPTAEGVWYVLLQDTSKHGIIPWPDPQQDPGTLLLLPAGTVTVSVGKSINMYTSGSKQQEMKQQKKEAAPPARKKQ